MKGFFFNILFLCLHSIDSTSPSSSPSSPIPSDYLLSGFDEFGLTDELYGGYMPIDLVDNQEGSFFFLLSKLRKTGVKTSNGKEKLIIWLNGFDFDIYI